MTEPINHKHRKAPTPMTELLHTPQSTRQRGRMPGRPLGVLIICGVLLWAGSLAGGLFLLRTEPAAGCEAAIVAAETADREWLRFQEIAGAGTKAAYNGDIPVLEDLTAQLNNDVHPKLLDAREAFKASAAECRS